MLPDIWKKFFKDERFNRDSSRLTRKLRSLRHMGSTKVQIGSHEFLNFSGNDYLGLTGDLRIAEAAASAAGRFGWGTAASRLVTGSSTLHTKLEGELAAFRGTEAALVYGSGYQANLGVISALVGAGDTVLSDELNHASIVAGCRLSGASVRVFGHRDYDDLERQLNTIKKGRILVVTDSLFSIEGDTAELPRTVKLCERHNALLVVDDAHANACLGKRGRGMLEIQGVTSQVPIVVATFSKALGSYGGFVACTEEVRDFLVNNSRPFIYTTSIPIALAAANLEALKIVRKEGDALRQKLATNTSFARNKLESAGFELTGDYQVIGIRVGNPEEAVFLGNEVEFHGILVHPMRYPTVRQGSDSLRISITAAHTEEDINRLVQALKKARNSTAKKKTDGLTRRQNKRPTHQSLETTQSAAADDFGDFDDHPSSQSMSAVDSSRLPPASEVGDFRPPDDPPGAGDTLLVNPDKFEGNENPTAPVPKDQEPSKDEKVDSAEPAKAAEGGADDAGKPAGSGDSKDDSETTTEAEDAASVDSGKDEPDADTGDPESASGEAASDEEIDEELPTDDPETSGATLAPEQMELADPVIADIEGGTKKRKRKTMRQKKSDD
ncbi:MAG: aminotransferase class I/II-fold pyridoxal phosphate-dependent enzyme [Planctomycetes bacterium]|nr:aminotransferase class I/II-fold pyridoxal phosphate-dependent enzyme [Planctomycetota bacterium]